MGAALQVITGRVTNAGGNFTALTANTGDAFQIQNFDAPAGCSLLQTWALGATAGISRVHSPKMHDNVQGIRTKFLAATPQPMLATGTMQPMQAQDTFTFEISDSGTETDLATLLFYYNNLPGSDAQLFDWPSVSARIRNLLTVEQTLTTGSTLGDYGGSAAINTNFDLLKANTNYAVLGYLTDTSVCTVGLRGPDTGNYRVGGPGTSTRVETRRWFVSLTEQTGLPLIPVINAANKGATLADLAHNASGSTVVVEWIMAELAS